MHRVTITLSDERYQALKEASTKYHKSLTTLIDESLEHYGIKNARTTQSLVATARARASLSESSAINLALEEIRAERNL
ncbi:MAG: hypothetical protein ACRESZ_04200 [Methylococcales bacterium]